MAWSNITAYTGTVIAAVKADLKELASLIDARIADVQGARGHSTEEEDELRLARRVVDGRYLDYEAELLADATLEVEATTDKEVVLAAIEAAIEAAIDEDTGYEIIETEYTEVEAGTTDGTLKFEVVLMRGQLTRVTDELTMTIKNA